MACQAYPDAGLDTRSRIEYTYAWLAESILGVEINNIFDDFLFLCEKALYYTFSNNDVTFTPISHVLLICLMITRGKQMDIFRHRHTKISKYIAKILLFRKLESLYAISM